MMRLLILASLLLVAVVAPSRAAETVPVARMELESGHPFIRNFSPKEYGAHGQNWAMVQDARGVLYVANNNGVLEYDGVRWRLIPTEKRTCVRSLAVDGQGRVYVGAKGELGYLAPNTAGKMCFVSLIDRIEPQAREFSDVWWISITSQGVYFTTVETLFCYAQDRIQMIQLGMGITGSFAVGNRLFLRQTKQGLLELEQGTLRPVPGGQRFSETGIVFMLPWDEGRILIGTRFHGLFLFDGKSILPFSGKSKIDLGWQLIERGILLPDGNLALATRQSGLLLLDRQGRVWKVIDKHSGLQDNAAKHVFTDGHSALWLALNSGISRIQWPSPLTRFGTESGFDGSVATLCRHEGILYIATSQGVSILDSGKVNRDVIALSQPSFKSVKGLSSQCWDLISADGTLLVADFSGVLEIQGGVTRRIWTHSTDCLCLFLSKRDPTRIYVGLSHGIATLQRSGPGKGSWKFDRILPNIHEEIRSIAETENGNLWLGTMAQGLLNVSQPNGPAPLVERFSTTEGLPTVNHNFARTVGDEILFATHQGLYRFDEAAHRFLPDERFTHLFPEGSRWIEVVRKDTSGRLWMSSCDEARGIREAGFATFHAGSGWQWEPTPFLRFGESTIYAIAPEEDGVVWFGGPDGLYRFNPRIEGNYEWPHPALVRCVISHGNRLLNGGSIALDQSISLKYAENSLRFEYGIPGADPESAVRFQVRLDGYDKDWSLWSTEAYKEYTNLPEGSFHFRIRARNIYGSISSEGSYFFRIFPPVYRTWWAYLMYVVLFAAQGYGLLRWRLWKLRQEKRDLEKKVQERTHELAESNSKLQDAQNQIARLMESPSNLLEDIPAWATAVARDIQGILGSCALGVYEIHHGKLETILALGWELPPELPKLLESSGGQSTHGGTLMVPARGLTGTLLGVVVVRGLQMERLGPERQLLNGFANQLGSALEMLQIRRKLASAEAQRATSIEELHTRGIETLKVCPRCGRCFGHHVTHCKHDRIELEIPGLLPLRILERYRFTRCIGMGGMGAVYQAHDENLDRDVAIKLMKPELFNNATARLRFEREARTMVQVNHPGVVTVYDSGEVGDGTLFLILELLRGMSLGSALHRFGPGSPSQVARLLRQGSEALDAAHRVHIVHRDIKPQNIFLVPSLESFQVKLLDFGLAKPIGVEGHVTQTGLMLGTPAYMVPETILGREADARSDLFSFATVIYEALLGWSTVQGKQLPEIIQGILYETPVAPSQLATWFPPAVDTAFRAALAKEPDQRPQDILQWARDLANLLEMQSNDSDGWPDPLPMEESHASDQETGSVDLESVPPEDSRGTRQWPQVR